MALVRKMDRKSHDSTARHSEATASYSIVVDEDGKRLLQIDTYGSPNRRMPGKVSQSLRFSPEAINQLRQILGEEKL